MIMLRIKGVGDADGTVGQLVPQVETAIINDDVEKRA
jgi:hypothetical protein